MMIRYLLITGLLMITACGESVPTSDPVAADAVYVNASIYTVDSDNSWASAMAISDGKIVAVGNDEDVMAHAGDATTVVDLDGRMVMPGIHDTHIHPADAGVQKRLQCYFLSYDLNEVLDVLKTCIADMPEGSWVRGGQWNEGLFASGKMPKTILDEIAPNHPVFLMDWSWHNAWVNSKALEVLGIGDDTPDPTGGIIVRDSQSGEANGILLDNAAYGAMRGLPEYPLEDRAAALAWSLGQIAQYGVTTIKDAITITSSIEAYAELDRRGELPVRVKTALSWKSAWAKSHEDENVLIDTRADYATGTIGTDFAKIMLDGVPIPPKFTAAMLEPYTPNELYAADWDGGPLIIPAEELTADVIELDRRGLSVKIHATGDRSVRASLDAFEAALEANGDSGNVHEVSHAELIHPDDIPRFAELGVAAEMCPILWHPIPGLDWDAWVGPDRDVWPVKSLVESGALVTYGSDWSVVPTPNPWPGIEAMVTRAEPVSNGEETLWAEQAVDLQTTIRIFTANSAIANGAGDTSGSLEVGKDADFIVLNQNIFEVPINDVGETEVLLSVVGGTAIIDKL